MKKVSLLRTFRAKIALKRRALRLTLCNVCHIGTFMKWLYERENHVIIVIIATFFFLLCGTNRLP